MNHYLITQSDAIAGLSNSPWIECDVLALKVCDYHDCIWITTRRPDWKELLQSARRVCCHLAILSCAVSRAEMEKAFAAGASAYCSASSDSETLDTVSVVLRAGGIWIPDILRGGSQHINSAYSSNNTSLAQLSQLTRREKDVLECILNGLTNKEAAKLLSISERTVKEFVGTILSKFKAKDRVDLLLKIGNFTHLKDAL